MNNFEQVGKIDYLVENLPFVQLVPENQITTYNAWENFKRHTFLEKTLMQTNLKLKKPNYTANGFNNISYRVLFCSFTFLFLQTGGKQTKKYKT